MAQVNLTLINKALYKSTVVDNSLKHTKVYCVYCTFDRHLNHLPYNHGPCHLKPFP
jgi:hypothetical protein